MKIKLLVNLPVDPGHELTEGKVLDAEICTKHTRHGPVWTVKGATGETVGVLMDQNMTPPQGVFVDFFGLLACTASGIARVALKTNAAVVPAFTIWDPVIRKYRVHFEPAVTLIRTGNHEADVLANTAKFTKVIEEFVRKYPDQWLWVHKRWKTRPPGEPPLY